MDVFKYCSGGRTGTPMGGLAQLGNTLFLRFFFCLTWNWCSAQPIGEFGGIGAFVGGKEWVPGQCHTYLEARDPAEEADDFVRMVGALVESKVDVSVSVYTQITDVELECDGFLNYDRTSKFNASATDAIAAANRALIEAPA